MLLEKSFYFLRHGQTDHNARSIIAGGKTDSPLNEHGQRQARTLGARLTNPGFKKVVCSPMKRAMQTAQLVTTLPLLVDHDLREWEMGDFEGATYESFIKHIEFLPAHVALPNGESKKDFYARSIAAINKALTDHGEDVLVVAHGGVAFAVFEALGLPGEDVENAQLIYFKYHESQWHVVKLH